MFKPIFSFLFFSKPVDRVRLPALPREALTDCQQCARLPPELTEGKRERERESIPYTQYTQKKKQLKWGNFFCFFLISSFHHKTKVEKKTYSAIRSVGTSFDKVGKVGKETWRLKIPTDVCNKKYCCFKKSLFWKKSFHTV